MRRIVAAVDLTPLGRRVGDRARMVAERQGGTVSLIHVIEPVREAFYATAVEKDIRAYRERAAGELADWVSQRTDVEVTLDVVKGSADWEIVRASKNADLTVIGTSPVDASDVGFSARRVTEMSRTDVLLVRRQPRVPYRKVVVGVDFSEGSRLAVEEAVHLAPDADLTLVHALPTRFDPMLLEAGWFPEEIDDGRRMRLAAARDAMQKFAAAWPQARTQVVDGPAREVIEEVGRKRSADLVAVGSRGAGATRMVLLGTVASAVLDAVPSDVLVARVPGDFRRP